MASEPILAVEPNIDDRIIQFCKARPGLTEEQVVRDIARIVCIVNLVRNGTLDGKNTVSWPDAWFTMAAATASRT